MAGRVKLSGNLGAQVPYGKALPSTLGTAAMRGLAKAGVGKQTRDQTTSLEEGRLVSQAFGIPMGKQTSKGRQGQPVKAQKPTKVAKK